MYTHQGKDVIQCPWSVNLQYQGTVLYEFRYFKTV